MHLYIAEKPSLARAIAAALPGPHEKGQGWIRCGKGPDAATVSWCIGHLLEPAEPARYNPAWKKWRIEDLPMFPEPWQLTPKDSVRLQFKVLEALVRKADLITHAGDPDREGQLLVDEVLRYLGTKAPVKRILINDLTPKAVARAIQNPRDNREFRPLSHSALARQRADWLYGINLTRFYTLSYQTRGEQGVFSVGRVQTPVLGLVVDRDNTIEHFQPKPWYRVEATFQASEPEADQRPFIARWLPGDEFQDHLDEENRLLDKSVAEQIVAAISGRPGRIDEARVSRSHGTAAVTSVAVCTPDRGWTTIPDGRERRARHRPKPVRTPSTDYLPKVRQPLPARGAFQPTGGGDSCHRPCRPGFVRILRENRYRTPLCRLE